MKPVPVEDVLAIESTTPATRVCVSLVPSACPSATSGKGPPTCRSSISERSNASCAPAAAAAAAAGKARVREEGRNQKIPASRRPTHRLLETPSIHSTRPAQQQQQQQQQQMRMAGVGGQDLCIKGGRLIGSSSQKSHESCAAAAAAAAQGCDRQV
eukprot:499370-Pelagomonas_calceolata.AAC.3